MKEIEGPILPKICDWMLNKNYESRFPSFSFISSKMAGQQTRWGEQTKKRRIGPGVAFIESRTLPSWLLVTLTANTYEGLINLTHSGSVVAYLALKLKFR